MSKDVGAFKRNLERGRWVLGAFADGCGCFLTFLVALDYWLCVALEQEKVLESKQALLPISNVEPYPACYSNYRCFTLLFVCMGVQLSQ